MGTEIIYDEPCFISFMQSVVFAWILDTRLAVVNMNHDFIIDSSLGLYELIEYVEG